MLEKTWAMRPGKDWYFFVEADTYVFWANTVHWLRYQSGLDPREKLYLGSRSFIGGTPFAHGGSGFVLSGALLRHLIEDHPGIIAHYNVQAASECCGDLMLARALEQYEQVKLSQAWPMFNGEKPSTLPYGHGHWCEPILTMHHVSSEEISTVWQFEETRKSNVSGIIGLATNKLRHGGGSTVPGLPCVANLAPPPSASHVLHANLETHRAPL